MKKIILTLLILCSLKCFSQPATPSGFTFLNQRYDWLEGKFRTLHIPSGNGTPTLYGGWIGAGAVYWDSIGKKLYAWDGASWAVAGGGAGSALTINAPLTGSSYNGSAPVSIGITKSDATHDGYLSQGDWNTFNGKASSLTVGTAAQRLALSPTDGLEFFQTNDARNAPAGKYYYLDGIWNNVPMRDEDFWYYFNDFSGTSHTTALSNQNTLNNEVSGTNATIAFVNNNSMWYGNLSTGTTAAGYVKINTGQTGAPNVGIRPSTMNMYYQMTIQSVSQKANQVDNFNIDAGFTGGGTTNPPTGYFFRYDSTTSANWLYRNGGNAFTSTGVAFAATTPYTLEVFARNDSVFYWINNSLVAQEATVTPSTFVQPYTRLIKTLGTTAVTMSVDYIKIWARLQSSRTIFGN